MAHIDLYRLETANEAMNIGIEDYLNSDGVAVIEWAERIEPLLPAGSIRFSLRVVDENTRSIERS